MDILQRPNTMPSDTGQKTDYSHLPKLEYEWTRTVHGNVKEEIPKEIPKP